jgi:hypothetical protein
MAVLLGVAALPCWELPHGRAGRCRIAVLGMCCWPHCRVYGSGRMAVLVGVAALPCWELPHGRVGSCRMAVLGVAALPCWTLPHCRIGRGRIAVLGVVGIVGIGDGSSGHGRCPTRDAHHDDGRDDVHARWDGPKTWNEAITLQ